MKKFLTLTLAIVALAVLTGVAVGQGARPKDKQKSPPSSGDRKPAPMKAPVPQEVTTVKGVKSDSDERVSAHTKKMAGTVTQVNETDKTFTITASDKQFTFDARTLKVLPAVGQIIDITYTKTPGGPLDGTIVQTSQNKKSKIAGEKDCPDVMTSKVARVNPNDSPFTIMTKGKKIDSSPKKPNALCVAGMCDVGVIPKGPVQCPAGSEYITIYMDDEDNSNSSSMSGWTGATSHRVTDHVNGTQLGFCRVDGSLFFNLGHANLINWENVTTDPQKASVGAYDYSVLKLGTSCPNGSKEHVRIVDNEDDHNKNESTGDIGPNNVHVTNRGKTALYFCLFTPSSGPSRPDFPDIGITYGVFAGKVAPPTGPDHRNYWLATGTVFTDDEDRRNQDETQHADFSNDDIFAAGAGLTIGGENTTFNIAKVRDITGLCSRNVSWWDGSQVQASFDTANCFVRNAPSGSQPFVWANKYYIKPTPSQNCPLGSLTSGVCFIMIRPPGGFISNNAFYVPASSSVCPSVPPGWTLTGSYCVLAAPWGTQAFTIPFGFGGARFYTTTLLTCQDGSFDGANCYIGTPPPGTTAFIWANKFYYSE